MSEFVHWSAEPLGQLENRNPIHRWKRDKPHGLWFSVGDGPDSWREWCEREEFMLDSLVWRNVITFRDDARILRISGGRELDAFDDEYRPYPDDPDWDALRLSRYAIDWARVGERYQGIIIAPYCWSRRMDLDWYYGWDCASGCVWDVSAIADISSEPGIRAAAASAA